ncbi:hypothetical protein B296_00025212 [Ensete ventricosum]|uniref:Uncharacterized protein n=1 Tax=Ensete ventricosum TaxID=4639 RepID=A0A426YZM8_ENSVE|nr:hypothetical protein B296_00025212 [Ensete ventricosum]
MSSDTTSLPGNSGLCKRSSWSNTVHLTQLRDVASIQGSRTPQEPPSKSIPRRTSETRQTSLEVSHLFPTNADELVHMGETKSC